MGRVAKPKIVTCAQWGARPARGIIKGRPQPDKTIFHHTAGLGGKDKKQYAREIQAYHMDHNGWIDTGNNFTVCTDGTILEGRHGSVDAVDVGRMVDSAHCVGQNGNPGVEHEEIKGPLTGPQFDATVKLHAWIADRCHLELGDLFRPHREFNATACPGDIASQAPRLRAAVAAYTELVTQPAHKRLPKWFWVWAQWRLGRGAFQGHGSDPEWRPVGVPETIPAWAWARLAKF